MTTTNMAHQPPPVSSPEAVTVSIALKDTHNTTSDIINLGRNVSLRIEQAALVIQDETQAEAGNGKSRTCGIGSPTADTSTQRSIPLYNVLWAELSEDQTTLTIDFAEETSKTRLNVAKLSYPTSPASEDDQHHFTPLAALPPWIETLLSRSYGPAAPRKRAYVLVNPHAGPGGAEKKWNEQVRPIFEAARMPITVELTTFSGQAIELCQQMDIENFDIVVPCSGDGLPYEVFNGLGKRPDARRALQKLAIAHIPCGSGNALACNVFGTHRPSLAALAIVKGIPTPMDLVSITQGENRTLSFLSQALGIVAESDLATEHLRWMGGSRFTYGFLVRLFKKKIYPCELHVKVEIEHKDGVREHYRRERLNSSVDALDKGLAEELVAPPAVGSSSMTDSEATGSASDEGGLPPLKYGTINDKVPAEWDQIPGDKMGNFYCGNIAYMAPDANFFSAACINDGLMDLVTIDGDIPPWRALQLMLSVENGHFFDNPLVAYRKIAAFRITPKDQEDGYISIDGERIPFAPFQAEVHRGLGMVITKRGMLEAPGPREVTASQRLMA